MYNVMMKLDSIRIVLVETSHPGNIGSTARAMKTMGLHRLYLVNPAPCLDGKSKAMAASAVDVLHEAVITQTLDEALAGCQLIIGTSARKRGLALDGLTPRDAADLVKKQRDETEVAIVFGREDSGLTNDELFRCHYHLIIPANPVYSALNLSQAVQIVAYELRMAMLVSSAPITLKQEKRATAAEIEGFYSHLLDVMLAINFYKPKTPGRLLQRVRRLFNRANLEVLEVNILRGILTQMQKIIQESGK